ncbi:class I SAM-dependent methyltransferase [Faecalibacter rhinopitheci]|uniref:Class I SAM-dependent methyltransferase n=1 Tax=Faecalibacter rhinopitheci TaxID=2779678 RepID=A0A8J7KA98_9FLAO|nr:class I SAM-dependent methyltransferase [Faecalibacter rhinopitheci]MBF0597250.1 class I SAM-dependent methyltransferase [Faecalibacter rhinopitheci]
MNYNFIAPYYDILSRICFLNRQQIAHHVILKHLKSGNRILWIGGGSGWFLQELNSLQINLEIDYVELSKVMVDKASSKIYENLKVNYYCEDMFSFNYNRGYDVVISAFIFDHFTEIQCEKLFRKINPFLIKGGKWFYLDFSTKQTKFQQFLTQSMIMFFNVVAGLNNSHFPKIDHLFNEFELVEEVFYFKKYIRAQVFRK